MGNKITSYLPTETEITDIAVKFSFKDKIELRYGINNAYWQLKIFSYAKRSVRDPSILIEELNRCSKDMQNVVSRLSGPELQCLMENYDNGTEDLLYELTNNLSLLERLTENTLINTPSAVVIAKKIPVWWFVWELADLWRAEIKTKPICNYSVINGYTGKFYRFVMAVASLNADEVYVTGATVKNVLVKWHEANPMYARKLDID